MDKELRVGYNAKVGPVQELGMVPELVGLVKRNICVVG